MSDGGRRDGDAVHLEDGCTGRIGLLTVTQSIADGVKVAEGAHDLTIEGGSIRCLAKLPVLHQDGIQVMGGARITFENLNVSCGRPGESLINSNLFIKESGRSTTPPTDVVCVELHLRRRRRSHRRHPGLGPLRRRGLVALLGEVPEADADDRR